MNAAFKRVSQHREKERLFAQDDISSCANNVRILIKDMNV